MDGAKAKLLLYEPVIEWICGMSYIDYEVEKPTTYVNGQTDGTNGHTNGVNGH